MYYAEKIINGILNYRTSPRGLWKPLGLENLTNKITSLEHEIKKLQKN